MGKKNRAVNRTLSADEIAGSGDFLKKGAYVNYIREKLSSRPDFINALLRGRLLMKEAYREKLTFLWAKAKERLQKNSTVSMPSLVAALPYGWGNRKAKAIATKEKKASIEALSFLDKELFNESFQTIAKREPISAVLEKILLSSFNANVKSKVLGIISKHCLVECIPAIKIMLSDRTNVPKNVESLANELLRKFA